jgi:N6-L-threonylcarbamoyladenine synthase
MLVLGIESSCDETAAAVVDETGRILSNVVYSQIATHREYGGVVPELASRDHLKHISRVTEQALQEAGLSLGQLDRVAVTCSPGLSGSLLVGLQMARGLAWAADLPLVAVDHLVGHLLSPFVRLDGEPVPALEFPYLALLVSGGHTALYHVGGPTPDEIEELGATRDDAAGEAFDKVAKLTGLGYPGGPIIDRLAQDGNADAVSLAAPMRRKDSLDLSFSGLKTDVARWVEKNGPPGDNQTLRDLCAAFQRRVVESLLSKTFRATREQGLTRVVLVGGVAANRELRKRAELGASQHGFELHIPPPSRCTDNAAMIAYAGIFEDPGTTPLSIQPHTRLRQRTRKGKGRR